MAFGRCNGGGRRSAARAKVPLTAVITTRLWSRPAILVDLSSTGARLSGSVLPRKGEELLLSIESVKAFGVTAWAHAGKCGVAFNPPLETGELKELQRKLLLARGLSAEVKGALDDWNQGLAR